MNMNLNEKEVTKTNRKIDLSGFQIKDELNPKIWDEDQKMRPEVKKTLLKIADDYFESLDISGVDIEDVTMTGSLANYNWSKYSDVDLHIVVDYKDIPVDEDLVQDFLKSKSSAWNKEHDVKIYGYDVELYVQDINEPHHSTGVYSILNNEWDIKPEKKKISFDDKSVKDKSNMLMDRIEDLYDELIDGDYETAIKGVEKLTEKIKKMRQSGLDSGGEFSVENIVFKVLRRNGMLDRLYDIKTVAYDKEVTLESIQESKKIDSLLESIENDPLKWIKDVETKTLIEKQPYRSTEYDIVGEFFNKKNIDYKGWVITWDGFQGIVEWRSENVPDILYIATPYWDGADNVPVNYDYNYGDDYGMLGFVDIPNFEFEEDLNNWLENNYFEEVYKLITNHNLDYLGPLAE
jgi:hypothetical protein